MKVVAVPEIGQAVRVRNRLATVRAVEPYDARSAKGRLHIVDVEYLDDFRYPEAEQLLWEVEATAVSLGNTSLPSVDANRPDSPDALQAFVNAHRWTRVNRLKGDQGIEDEPLLGVWNSAIQVHYYQLDDRADEGQTPPVVVELPGSVRVQIPPGCDAATIQAVLQAASMLRPGGPSSC
jgi:hypothetical protein